MIDSCKTYYASNLRERAFSQINITILAIFLVLKSVSKQKRIS